MHATEQQAAIGLTGPSCRLAGGKARPARRSRLAVRGQAITGTRSENSRGEGNGTGLSSTGISNTGISSSSSWSTCAKLHAVPRQTVLAV